MSKDIQITPKKIPINYEIIPLKHKQKKLLLSIIFTFYNINFVGICTSALKQNSWKQIEYHWKFIQNETEKEYYIMVEYKMSFGLWKKDERSLKKKKKKTTPNLNTIHKN
jgi:hypothetical protein